INLAAGCFAVNGTCLTASVGSVWPWTIANTFGTSTNATTTGSWFQQGLYASSTSQIAYASTTAISASSGGFFGFASTTNLTISGLGQSGTSCLQITAAGVVQATGSACGTSSGGITSITAGAGLTGGTITTTGTIALDLSN